MVFIKYYVYVKEYEEDSVRELLPINIGCKSLISINSASINTLRKKSINFEKLLNDFRHSTRRRLPVIAANKFLFEISKTLQSEFRVESLKVGEKLNFSFEFNNSWSSSNRWPFSSCDSFQYKPKDVGRCFTEFQRSHNKTLRIAFVGDSMIRSVLEGIVLFIKDEVKLKHFNISEDLKETFKPTYFIDKKFKRNIVLANEGIEFRFYWATYIMQNANPNESSKLQGAKELLQKWAYQNEHQHTDPVPDILYIGTGMWNFTLGDNTLQTLDEHIVMIKQLNLLLDKISKRTLILWHIHPTYLWFTTHKVSLREEGLSWMNQLAYLYLSKNDKIWLWDSYAAFALKEKLECQDLVNVFENKSVMPQQFRCFDSLHPGIAAQRVAVNMIFNVACNRVLGIKGSYCCQ
ncbi:UNVERIFIED_CONTAM: hypothetical protein RMT77_000295 [Armadillidium vulgare]